MRKKRLILVYRVLKILEKKNLTFLEIEASIKNFIYYLLSIIYSIEYILCLYTFFT
jgi:hypothetical protein